MMLSAGNDKFVSNSADAVYSMIKEVRYVASFSSPTITTLTASDLGRGLSLRYKHAFTCHFWKIIFLLSLVLLAFQNTNTKTENENPIREMFRRLGVASLRPDVLSSIVLMLQLPQTWKPVCKWPDPVVSFMLATRIVDVSIPRQVECLQGQIMHERVKKNITSFW